MTTHKLLISDRPLMLLPELAKLVGVEEAIILQQVHFLCSGYRSGRVLSDGHRYVWNTVEDWRRDFFPFWSGVTIRRKFKTLKDADLLIGQSISNDTKVPIHYRVNYEHLSKITGLVARDPDQSDRGTPINLIANPDQSDRGLYIGTKTTQRENPDQSDRGTNDFTDEVMKGLRERLNLIILPDEHGWIETMIFYEKNDKSPADLLAVYDHLKNDDFWRDKTISPQTIAKQIAILDTKDKKRSINPGQGQKARDDVRRRDLDRITKTR